MIIHTDIINLDKSIKLFGGNSAYVEEFLKHLAVDLSKQIQLVKQAHQISNNDEIRRLLHRLEGGLSYCDTPRFCVAIANLNKALADECMIEESIIAFENEAELLIKEIQIL